MEVTARRICPLCEATCGVVIVTEGDDVVSVRGDAQDPLSRGYICPKGIALGELHHDPHRLRTPLVRDAEGELREASWDDAFDAIRVRLSKVVSSGGPDATAVYLGNPNIHNPASTFYGPALIRALGTSYRFSASTVDQMPKQVACGLMYGTELSVPVPDIDRTSYLLILGGNPLVSNGSLWTVPDFPKRLRALRQRGGRLVVVDPVRTRTADQADEHIRIRPGADALFLASLVHLLAGEPLAEHLRPHIERADLDRIAAAVADLTPEATAPVTGIAPEVTRRIARELREADAAAIYGRMGTTTSGLALGDTVESFATVASWLLEVTAILTGNLDRPGGTMWPLPAAGGPTTAGEPGRGRGIRIPGSMRSRVSGAPSALGEFPSALLAEEIESGGVRALIVIAGNPVVSTPDGGRLARALGTLDLMVSVDPYLTDTSRHADVILPTPSPLSRPHYDLVFSGLAVRNTARFAPATFPLAAGEMDEGRILLQLACIAAASHGLPEPSVDDMEGLVAGEVARRAGTRGERALAQSQSLSGVERLLDISLRAGPYPGLSLDGISAGLDLGPLAPRLPEVLRTPSGRIELAPAQIVDDLRRAARAVTAPAAVPQLVLIGRRQPRRSNSWLNALPSLRGGSSRCTLQIHPDDAVRLGIADGDPVEIVSAAGTAHAAVETADAMTAGVVSLPHGWPGRQNSNLVSSTDHLDPLSGTSALHGIPVEVRPCCAPAAHSMGDFSDD